MPFPNSLCTDGIDGTSQIQGRQNCSDVYAFAHRIESPRDSATGMASGARKHSVVIVTIALDKSAPLYAKALARNEVLSTVRIDLHRIKPATSGQEIFYTTTLRNARITSIRYQQPELKQVAGATHNTRQEMWQFLEISFAYEQIEWKHHPTNNIEEDQWLPPGGE